MALLGSRGSPVDLAAASPPIRPEAHPALHASAMVSPTEGKPMTSPASILSATAALFAVATIASADAVVPVVPADPTPAIALFGGGPMPVLGPTDSDLLTLSAIPVSHGVAPTGGLAGGTSLGGLVDVNLGDFAVAALGGQPVSGLPSPMPRPQWPGGLGASEVADKTGGSSDTPSIPVPPAAGLGGAALAAMVAAGRRRPLQPGY